MVASKQPAIPPRLPQIREGLTVNHNTSIGLDVHARSVTAVALDSLTGEVRSQRFAYSPAEVAEWISQFESPKAVYESGVTGFHLVRELRALGIDCIVGAAPKMERVGGGPSPHEGDRDRDGVRRRCGSRRVLSLRLGARVRELARARALRAFERRAREPRHHHQGRKLPFEEASRRGVLALREGNRGKKARPERPCRPVCDIQPCRSRSEEACRATAPPHVRFEEAARSRERRHRPRAGLLDMGARAHERRDARVDGRTFP